MQEPNNNLKEHPDLYKRSIKGGYWVFAVRLATQLLGFAKSIIVFNFLFKANLELVIIANLLMAILTTSTESGFHAALIQKKEDIEDYLDTAWVFDIMRGTLLFALIYIAAPWFASFKVAPEDLPLAISVIRAMGACFLIGAFQNIGIVYFQKEMQFHKTFWLSMAGTLTDIILSIILVLALKSVWGYVIARLATTVVNLGLTYLMCPYRPRFHFVPQKALELWKFGKWLFGGNIIGYLLSEGDDWFVWFYLGGGPLKLYRYAYNFSNMPATHIANTISQVSFPAYSKIQHDTPRLRQAYFKVLQLTALISIPTAFLIFALGPDFVRLFLVEESHAMIPVIQILAAKGLLRSLGSTVLPIFRAMGKPQTALHINCAQLALLAITIYPLAKIWGIVGVSVSTVLVGICLNPFILAQISRILKCRLWEVLRLSLIPAISACLTGGIVMAVKNYLFTECTIVLFLGLAVSFVIVYVVVMWIFDYFFNHGIRQISNEQINYILRRVKGNRMESQ